MTAPQPLLLVEDIRKSYSSPSGMLQVLDGVSFTAAEGEFVAVVGESGSGKSTLLQVLGTLDEPDGGRAELGGRPLLGLSRTLRAALRNESIGFVYQAHHLIPELTAIENVALPLLIRGVSRMEAEKRASDLLERLHLNHRLEHVPARLSGGEAQRVAVARALVGRPRLLLADEPTGNLDEHTAGDVYASMQQLCREEAAAVVMVTHSMALAQASDSIYCLSNGKLEKAEGKKL
jgi:lipoprotein-releasing system ATP-binding protein